MFNKDNLNDINDSNLGSVLGLVVARGGSKGLPKKNLKMVAGIPLISWTIDAALKSGCIDRVVLSSDCSEIMSVAAAMGCEVPFKRPSSLATDEATSIDVVLHALDNLPDYDFVVLLQPTSPLRTSEDIDSAFNLIVSSGAPSCVSVCEASESPYWMFNLEANLRLSSVIPNESIITRRQDLPPVYVLNGAIYIARVDWLRRTKSFFGHECVAYKMPRERSMDIDTAEDFEKFRQKIECESN